MMNYYEIIRGANNAAYVATTYPLNLVNAHQINEREYKAGILALDLWCKTDIAVDVDNISNLKNYLILNRLETFEHAMFVLRKIFRTQEIR